MSTRFSGSRTVQLVSRACSLAALALLLPLASQAQRLPRRTGIGAPPPSRPAPLPPQAPEVRKDLRYRFSKYSMETYSLFSVTQVDRYVSDSAATAYGMQGEGLRIDYRYRPTFSITGDFASTFFGGPFMMQRVELGGRLHSDRLEEKMRPFADIRGSWAHTFDTYAQPIGNSITTAPSPLQYTPGMTQSNGFGAFAGGGMDYGISRNFAITSELGLSRHRLGHVTVAGKTYGSDWNYNATTVSFIIGVKYTGGRYVIMDPPMARQK
jgi:hypothetical protein